MVWFRMWFLSFRSWDSTISLCFLFSWFSHKIICYLNHTSCVCRCACVCACDWLVLFKINGGGDCSFEKWTLNTWENYMIISIRSLLRVILRCGTKSAAWESVKPSLNLKDNVTFWLLNITSNLENKWINESISISIDSVTRFNYYKVNWI